MAPQIFDSELNFASDVAVEWSVSPHALQLENETLKEQLVTRDRLIVERDAAIADLRREFAGLAVTAAERVIRKEIDAGTHRQLIDEVLAEAATGDRSQN